MKLCIPSTENSGIDSPVYGHFGSAPFFIIYNTEEDSIISVNNGDSVHEHGQCNPLAAFKQTPIDAMVTGGIGMRAINKLNAAGVAVYKSVTGKTVKDIIEDYKNNNLEVLSLEDACSHHH